MLKSEGDDRAPEYLAKVWEEEECQVLEAGNRYHGNVYYKMSNEDFGSELDGLACRSNKTLSIIAMDSLMYYQFAEGLGSNILQSKDKTAVVMIDKQVCP